MVSRTRTIAAIDVGTTKVFAVLGEVNGSGDVKVLGHHTLPCDGLRKGNVEDIAATAQAIRACVSSVEQQTRRRIRTAYVGVTGAHVSYENRHDTFQAIGAPGVITSDDLRRLPQRLMATYRRPDRRVLHALPMEYSVDGEGGIRNPVGMHSPEVEVDTHLVTGGSFYIEKLMRAVESAKVSVAGLVLEPLASGLSVLTPQEREQGAVIVDIGGGTTDVVAFKRGHVCYTSVIPVAGSQFTNDLVQTYDTTRLAAEEIKLKYASTDPSSVDVREEVTVPVVGKSVELQVQRREICQLVRERAQELVQLIRLKLQEAHQEDSPVVLTGGSSQLPGLRELVQRSINRRVRTGAPNGYAQVPKELMNPAYATGVGILLWAASDRANASTAPVRTSHSLSGLTIAGTVVAIARYVSRLSPRAVFRLNKGRS